MKKAAGTNNIAHFLTSTLGICDMDLHQLTTIFCEMDDFCKEFDKQMEARALPMPVLKNKRGPACCLSDSEIMTILIMFQSSRVRDFKNFYLLSLSVFYKNLFPKLPSYTRFVFKKY